MHELGTINDRAWWAYHCLPRGPRGRPPSYRSVELAHDLPLATLSKLFSGARKSVELDTAPKLAMALGVTVDWLLWGKGERPPLTGPIKPRKEQFQEHDPAYWAELAMDGGELDPSKLLGRHNFNLAVAYLGSELSPGAIKRVRLQHADKYPNGLEPLGWGKLLREEQRKVLRAQAERAKTKQPLPPKKRVAGDG